MADITTTPAKKTTRCPGWYHPFNYQQHHDNPNGHECEVDAKASRWLAGHTPQTTHAELEQYRQRAHAKAGVLAPADDGEE